MRIAVPLVFAVCLGVFPAAAQHNAQHTAHRGAPVAAGPVAPGQDAFGAIEEIVAILRADPGTDWGRADIDGLRAHLVDMNEVVLNARVETTRVPGGFSAVASGEGRTRDAIRRMVPAHAGAIDGTGGWRTTTEETPDGVRLTATAAEPRQEAVLRGLGFFGVLVSGGHHRPHHLAMARGAHAH